jgi:peptide chain release factor 3
MARLKAEYGVDAAYERVDFNVTRWVECDDWMSPLALAV